MRKNVFKYHGSGQNRKFFTKLILMKYMKNSLCIILEFKNTIIYFPHKLFLKHKHYGPITLEEWLPNGK